MTTTSGAEERDLFLAAEECPPDQFEEKHVFGDADERLIRALVAHGPVLLKGGRGAGKSALMLEAERRLDKLPNAYGFYVSLRYLPLLESTGAAYIKHLAELTSRQIQQKLTAFGQEFSITDSISELKRQLVRLATTTGRRVVLIFDDPAHIGREASLDEFFDTFRMISSAEISCKASIYPGVTRFGVRFDVYNDATVLEIAKDERVVGYDDFFLNVLKIRNPVLAGEVGAFKSLTALQVAGFLGRTVLGNMRAYILAANRLELQGKYEGVTSLRQLLISLASDYFWPLLEEVAPKLGVYEPLAYVAHDIGGQIYDFAGVSRTPSVTIRREICQSISKPLEILEYVGFLSKREASKALKSGGRGPRYRLNLATLLEKSENKMLSGELVEDWLAQDYAQVLDIGLTNSPIKVEMPVLEESKSLSILDLPIERLIKSAIYPYGLTDKKLLSLQQAGITTIGAAARTSDRDLDAIDGIGEAWVRRIKDVVNQAIWM